MARGVLLVQTCAVLLSSIVQAKASNLNKAEEKKVEAKAVKTSKEECPMCTACYLHPERWLIKYKILIRV